MHRNLANIPLTLLVLCLLLVASSPGLALPRLSICPSYYPEDMSTWPVVLDSIDIYKFYIDRLDPAEYPQLPALIEALREHDVQIAVEMAGLIDWGPCDESEADSSYAKERGKLQHLVDLGVTPDILVFDGPISRVVEGGRAGYCEMPLAEAIDQLVAVAQMYRQEWPDVQIALLVNFPHWQYGDWPAYHGDCEPFLFGEYGSVLDAVFAAMDEAGIPVASLEVDSPYDYSIGTVPPAPCSEIDPATIDWVARLRELEHQVSQHPGTEFCMIYNSDQAGRTSNAQFHLESLQWATLYPSSGGHPGRVMFQSWYPYPDIITPEWGDSTFMNIPFQWIQRHLPTPVDVTRSTAGPIVSCQAHATTDGPGITIELSLARTTDLRCDVFDLRGRLVRHLWQGFLDAGHHRLVWRGDDDRRRTVARGLYLARISGGETTYTLRLPPGRW